MTVGMIANPFAGKDVRRLVALGGTSANLTKVSILRRVLAGVIETGVRHVLYMPDPWNLVPAALDGLRAELRARIALEPAPGPAHGDPAETGAAAAWMAAQRTGCLISLGGDGTSRLVADACGPVPLLPLSTGTNNIFPLTVEPTLAGLAAGFVATGRVPAAQVCRRAKVIQLEVNGRTELAVVDLSLLHGDYTGARAIWAPDSLRELLVTRGAPGAVGLSGLAGAVMPVGADEPGGAYLRLGAAGRQVRWAVGPGAFATAGLAGARRVAEGEPVVLGPGPGVLALDGERMYVLRPGEQATARVEGNGPWVVDPQRAVTAAATAGAFIR